MKQRHPPSALPTKGRHITVADFLKKLDDEGLTVAEWTRQEKLPRDIVYSVLSGRALGKRGTAREVLKRIGLPLPPMLTRAG